MVANTVAVLYSVSLVFNCRSKQRNNKGNGVKNNYVFLWLFPSMKQKNIFRNKPAAARKNKHSFNKKPTAKTVPFCVPRATPHTDFPWVSVHQSRPKSQSRSQSHRESRAQQHSSSGCTPPILGRPLQHTFTGNAQGRSRFFFLPRRSLSGCSVSPLALSVSPTPTPTPTGPSSPARLPKQSQPA